MTATKGPGFQPVLAIPGAAPVPSILTSARDRSRDDFGTARVAALVPAEIVRVAALSSGALASVLASGVVYEYELPGVVGADGDEELLTWTKELARTAAVAPGSIENPASWRSGISWRSTQSLAAFGRALCGTGDMEAAPPLEHPAFYPYWLYVPYSCDWVLPVGVDGITVGGGGRTVEGETLTVESYKLDATNSLESMTAWEVSRELWTGAIEDDNPSLQNKAVDKSAAGAVHPTTALGILLENYSDCTQEGGAVIHAPLQAVVSLLHSGLIKQQGDVYYGPGGCVISPGPGYPAVATGTGPAGADAGAGNVWMYVTGPVEYALGDIVDIPDDIEAFYNPTTNRYEITPQRAVIHRFDTHCVFAVKTYIPSPTQGEAL